MLTGGYQTDGNSLERFLTPNSRLPLIHCIHISFILYIVSVFDWYASTPGTAELAAQRAVGQELAATSDDRLQIAEQDTGTTENSTPLTTHSEAGDPIQDDADDDDDGNGDEDTISWEQEGH